MKILDIVKDKSFWAGYFLCGIINYGIKYLPRCFLKTELNLYNYCKKIRDWKFEGKVF